MPVKKVVAPSPKPGYLTTEFLLTVVTMLCATGALIAGAIDADKWVLIFTGANGAYSLSRGIAKAIPPKESSEGPVD